MEDIKEIKLELLKETMEAYTVNTRSTVPDLGCVYESDDGRRCAMGRIMTPEAIALLKASDMNSSASIGRVLNLFRGKDIRPLQEKWMPLVEHHDFLDAMQSLHDRVECWNKDGLSSIGMARAERIRHMILSEDV